MSSKNPSAGEFPLRQTSFPGLTWQINSSPRFSRHDVVPSSDADLLKWRLGSSLTSTSSSTSESDVNSKETDSEEDDVSTIFRGNVPKLSLPILYEDEENPITVAISCKRCLGMEAILRNFTQMHLNAFIVCREKKEEFWEFIINWNKKLRKNLEGLKTHLIGEFISHIDQASLTEFKEDHDFRIQFNHYRLIFTHMKSMENRLNHRRQEISCPLRENYNIHLTDKTIKDLQLKVTAIHVVLQQLELRIRCIAKNWDNARAETNPQGFRQAIFTKEDYIFNRLCNLFICIDFLEKEGKFYEEKAEKLSEPKKRFLPLIQLVPRPVENLVPKPSNVKRRQQNSIKRKLPSAIAHLYPFTKPEYMQDVHTSWFRTFLKSDDVKKEISQQRDTNMRVLTDIQQLKKEIDQLETKLKMKEYVEQTKMDSGESSMFPEKVNKAPCFIDFNKMF